MRMKIENGNVITTIENGEEINGNIYTGPSMVISKSLPAHQLRTLNSNLKKKSAPKKKTSKATAQQK